MLKVRLLLASLLATALWLPLSLQTTSAIYCYPGDPPAVYNACVAYNGGIGQQVNNQNQLNSIQSQINDAVAQIYALDSLIASLKTQIDAQKALIAQTQKAIDDLSAKIRFGESALIGATRRAEAAETRLASPRARPRRGVRPPARLRRGRPPSRGRLRLAGRRRHA